MAGRKRRIGNFNGTAAEYRTHLEQWVHKLQQRVCDLEIELQHLRQRSCLACTTTIQHQPSTSGGLLIEFENPKPQATSQPNPDLWKVATKKFARRVPKNEEGWSDLRKRVGFCKPKDIIHTFRLLTRDSRRLRPLAIGDKPGSGASILDVVGDYRAYANELVVNKCYATQISYYSTLLFTCLCIIALRAGARRDAVDDQLREYLTEQQGEKCESEGTYLSQLRTAALWPVKRMDELYKKGLEHRAWEVFLHCMASLQYHPE